MSDNVIEFNPVNTNTLRVLQLNTRRSSAVTHSLLNDPNTLLFHFLLLQEPYIFPASNRPIAHPCWAPVLPHVPSGTSGLGPEDTTIKSLIYVNKKIPSTSIKPVNTFSNCISAVYYSLHTHDFLLISAYAPPKQAHKLTKLYDVLKAHPSSLTKHHIVGMDSNLHHPLWNPTSYKHKHHEADDLIEMMSEAGLGLRSMCGTPTFYPPATTHANTTIDLTWMSSPCLEWATSCVTDVRHEFSHLSDHAAITSAITLPSPVLTTQRSSRNWKKVDPGRFEADLTALLADIHPLLTQPATSQITLDHQTELIMNSVISTMNRHAPNLPLRLGAKRWWNKTTLNPLKAEAQRLRRHYQRHRNDAARVKYLEASKAYRSAIHETKRQHWRTFLDSLTPATLFTAAKFATADFNAASPGVPPLRRRSGTLTSDPDEQAELLFQGTSAPTVECDLEDVLESVTITHQPPRFTTLEVAKVINGLCPGKAPGRDEITNQAIQAGGEALAEALRLLADSCLCSG